MAAKPPTPLQISKVMAELGRRGGKVKGRKGYATLTPKQRSERAREGARARWGKAKKAARAGK